MLREGTYGARVSAFEGLTYSANGTPQVAIQFTTDEGTISTWLYLSDKAAKYTVEKLRLMGWRGNDVSEIVLDDLTADVEIVVAHEEYDGEAKAKVKWINAPGGGSGIKPGAPMGDAEKKAFAAKLKGMCMATKPGNGSAPAPKKPAGDGGNTIGDPNATGVPDDNCPF